MSDYTLLDVVLCSSNDFPSEADRLRAKVRYLETVLGAVLQAQQPEGGVLTVDVLEAARSADVLIHPVDREHALLIWGSGDPS